MRIEKEIPIGDKRGLHLRVVKTFVEMAQGFSSDVVVESDASTADGKSPLEMMLLQGSPGSTLRIRVDGEDAEDAARVLAAYITNPEAFDNSGKVAE